MNNFLERMKLQQSGELKDDNNKSSLNLKVKETNTLGKNYMVDSIVNDQSSKTQITNLTSRTSESQVLEFSNAILVNSLDLSHSSLNSSFEEVRGEDVFDENNKCYPEEQFQFVDRLWIDPISHITDESTKQNSHEKILIQFKVIHESKDHIFYQKKFLTNDKQ